MGNVKSEGTPPRLLRPAAAAAYLGVARNFFDSHIRPALTVILLGKRAIAFDRLDLDAWVDDYKARNGRPSQKAGALAPIYQQPPPAPSMAVKPTESSPARSRAVERAFAAIARIQSGVVVKTPTKEVKVELSVEVARATLIDARRQAVEAMGRPEESRLLGQVEKARDALTKTIAEKKRREEATTERGT